MDLKHDHPQPKASKTEASKDEEERQQKLSMMRRFYRNRHATFIKALLDQKKGQQQAHEDQRAKEEKKKKKLKEKALANLVRKEDLLPPIDGGQGDSLTLTTTHHSQILPSDPPRPRGMSVSVGQSERRMTSMSARNLQMQSIQNQRLERSKQMANIYGGAVAELDKPVMHKRLNRQNSRKSVRSNRSSHSVQTPMINRKFNDSQQNT